MAVISLEEAALLLAVHRVVGRVEVEDDLRRRSLVAAQEVADEQALDGVVVVADLLVALTIVDDRRRELEPVERALAGQRVPLVPLTLARRTRDVVLADRQRQHRVVPEPVVVVQVLVAADDAEHPLGHQFLHAVLDAAGIPVVPEARREPAKQPGPQGQLPHEQQSAVRGDPSGVERGLDSAAIFGLKFEPPRVTPCRVPAVHLGESISIHTGSNRACTAGIPLTW